MEKHERLFRNLFYPLVVAAWALGVLSEALGPSNEDTVLGGGCLLILLYVVGDAVLNRPAQCVPRAIVFIPFMMMGYLSTKILLDARVNADAAFIGTIGAVIAGVGSLSVSVVSRRLRVARARRAGG